MVALLFSRKSLAIPELGKAIKKSGTIFKLSAFTSLSLFSAHAFSQSGSEASIEEIVVTGTRATIQNSIELKRASTEIIDGLSADEIGDIPALSIGEALEQVTGSTSHRENGGASEISIRGLGPFLSNTVINGREATNGGGNRAVNYSIFPSELFNKIAVHKTQSAKYIEGAVGGQVHLDTKRPIEFGKQAFQFNVKGAYNPDEQNIDGGQDFGFRGTASYIDQFEFDDLGTFGISIGGQLVDNTNPEAEATTGTGGGRLEACQLESFDSNAQPVDTDGRCENLINTNVQSIIDGDPNINSVADIPFVYLPRDRRFRRNTTGDEREALFAALQWQPDDRWDVNLDVQYSERDQTELRQDVQFGLTQENITNLVSNPYTGVVESFTAETDIRANTTDFQRLEEYKGTGLNVEFQVNDDLEVSFDASYSDTRRTETDIEINMGATTDGLADGIRNDFLVSFDTNAPGTDGVALATIDGLDSGAATEFDITDPRFFTAADRAQLRARQIIRDNTITAFRGDFSLDTHNLGFITSLEGGARFSSLEYLTRGGNRGRPGINEFDDEEFDGVAGGSGNTAETNAVIFEAANNCGETNFPEFDFLSDASGGQDLFTNTNGFGNGSTFATFNFDCLGNTLLQNYGGLAGLQFENGIEANTNDVTEDTFAIYLQANFESEIADMPARGNFGIRVVDTDIKSVGYRGEITITEEDDGAGGTQFIIAEDNSNLIQTTAKSGYTEVLPSATLIVDLSEELMLRTGAFRGMSRPDPNAYGNGRSVITNDDDDDDPYASVQEALNGISATGNPRLKPLASWNLDTALEWYPNEDTLIAAGVYWKEFQGGFENVVEAEQFLIGGETLTGLVNTTQVSDKKSTLTGFELTAAHAFDYLPGVLSGLGAKFSYNYADSGFEFEDQNGGDGIQFNIDQDTGAVTQEQLIGILPPANLFGLSRHVSSTQVYWQNDRFNASVYYKTRSQYFQQFTRDTQGRVRYTDDNEIMEIRLSYELTDNVKVSLEGLNVLNEPRVDFRGVDGSVTQVLSYGPRYFFGLQAKF